MTRRSIFEEVGDRPAAAPPAGGMIDRTGARGRGAVRVWLMVLFALVVAMIAVGGLTRLTNSGLSITEWAPVTGAIPPLDAAAWEREFAAYQQIPEYRMQNAGMTLAEFKSIYWWEWGHRQLGRLVGLVWAAGFAALWFTRRVPPGWTTRLWLVGALGGLQGLVGWWMVSSGLAGTMTDVASYRLAVHLGLAFSILGLIAWYVFRLGRSQAALLQARRARERALWGMSTGLMHLMLLQVVLGALVAGIDAGRAYPTWPLMGDAILPPDPFSLSPVWRNFFEDAGLVQFIHRVSGYLVAALAVGFWVRARRSPHAATRFAANGVLAMVAVQVVLGIVTVLYSAQWHVAILHQLGAVALWVLILRARFQAGYPVAQSVRDR